MNSSSVLVHGEDFRGEESGTLELSEDRAGFAQEPARRTSAVRGMITGMVLGATFWGAILTFTGVIKL
jgi:hypothetical protein